MTLTGSWKRVAAKAPTGGRTNRKKFTEEAEEWLATEGVRMREEGESYTTIRDEVHRRFGVLVSRANILLRLRELEGVG